MKSTRILIAGQGLAGSMLALALWKSKADFLVIDEPTPSAASVVAGGAFVPIVFRTFKKAGRIDAYLPEMFSAFAQAEQMLGVSLLHRIPSVKLFPPSALSNWQAAVKGEASEFISGLLENVSLPGLQQGFSGAVIEPSGYVDTALLVNKTREWLGSNGLLVKEKLDYEKLTLAGGEVKYDDRIKAEKIVFCQGAAGVNNPWFGRAGFSLNKGEILEVRAPGLTTDYILRDEVFVLPLGGHFFRVGATYERKNINTQPGDEGRNELIQKLEKIIRVPYTVTAHVAGIRPAVKDRQPLIGNHPDYDNLFIFNGLGSKGVLFAPLWARELSQWLLTGKKNIPREVDVMRYFKQ